ncbi:MAG: hypothetical protein R3E64_08500 [Halioglobus sp.]
MELQKTRPLEITTTILFPYRRSLFRRLSPENRKGDINVLRVTVQAYRTVRYKDQRNVTLETPMALKSVPFSV